MRSMIIIFITFILFSFLYIPVSSTENNEYQFVMTKGIEYTSDGIIDINTDFFYDSKWILKESVLYNGENRQIKLVYTKYDKNNNLVEYYQEEPYITYKLYYDDNQNLVKIEAYDQEFIIENQQTPTSYEIFEYNKDSGLLEKEYDYYFQNNEYKLLSETFYEYNDKMLIKKTTVSRDGEYKSYCLYTYDEKGRQIRVDSYSTDQDKNTTRYEVYEYDEYDNLIKTKRYYENRFIGYRINEYKKVTK